MGKEFSITPRTVPRVETKYRRIVTPLPHPDSVPTLEKLRQFEPYSMRGQPPIVWDRAEDIFRSARPHQSGHQCRHNARIGAAGMERESTIIASFQTRYVYVFMIGLASASIRSNSSEFHGRLHGDPADG